MRKFTPASLGLAFLLGAVLSSAYLYVAPPAAPTLTARAGIGTPAVELATPGPEPTAPVVVDVAPTPTPLRPVHSALAPPSSASSARTAPTPWNPPLVVCPRPINGTNGEWVNLSSPPVCEPEHVYGFVAPAGWRVGDPVPLWRPAP